MKITPVLCCSQAVPYSRDYKQKYDYFRKKLKRPVRLFELPSLPTHCRFIT